MKDHYKMNSFITAVNKIPLMNSTTRIGNYISVFLSFMPKASFVVRVIQLEEKLKITMPRFHLHLSCVTRMSVAIIGNMSISLH